MKKEVGLTVTTVSLAPASPPARMLVSVDVFCFLVMVAIDVQKICGIRRKGTTLMNIHIYIHIQTCSSLIICWDGPGCQPLFGRCPNSTLRPPLRGRIRRWDVGSGCIHFLVETFIFSASNGSFPSHTDDDLEVGDGKTVEYALPTTRRSERR